MNRLILFTLACALTIAGCSSQEVSFSKATKTEYPPMENHFHDYWSAMACGMPQFADSFAVDGEKLIFARGLKEIKNGELEKAEAAYESLINSKNDTIKYNSQMILNDLYVYRSAWNDCLKLLKAPNESDSAAEERLFFPTFAGAKKEIVEFSKDVDTLPIIIRQKSIYVPITINGKKYEFLFDTGADLCVIAENVARECGVNPLRVHEGSLVASTGKTFTSVSALIDKLEIGNFTVQNHPSVIVEDANMRFKFLFYTFLKFDGIIGWNAIKNMDAEIDLARKILILRKPLKRNDVTRNLFWLSYPIVQVKDVNGYDFIFGFDTGAYESHVTDIFLQKIDPGELEDDSETYYGIGGKATRDVKVIPSIDLLLSGYKINFKGLNTGDQAGNQFLNLDGVFGINICEKGKFRIDAINGVFEMEKQGE
ncbi:MAG: TIGR02281 family clan AA aspartic protease [Chloroflexota bacterium]